MDSPPDARPRFQKQWPQPRPSQLTRSRQPGDPSPNDHNLLRHFITSDRTLLDLRRVSIICVILSLHVGAHVPLQLGSWVWAILDYGPSLWSVLPPVLAT